MRTRATGQIILGPLQAVGYDNRVLSVTLNEMEFKNSTEAQRFTDRQRRKYAGAAASSKMNRLRYVGRGDDY
jgi:hypothetical protein